MRTNLLSLMLAFSLLLCVSSVAAEVVDAGGKRIRYDEMLDYGDMKSYYRGDVLVLSTFDTDDDAVADQWFFYDEGLVLDSARQADDEGKIDYVVGYDELGNAVRERTHKPFPWMLLFVIFLGVAAAVAYVILSPERKKEKPHDRFLPHHLAAKRKK
jgi:hypothetical protein